MNDMNPHANADGDAKPLSLDEKLAQPHLQYGDDQTPQERLETLRARLIEALRDAASAEPDWRFREDYEYKLRDALSGDDEEVEKLFFGQAYDVENTCYENNTTYLADLDDDYIRTELTTLLGDRFSDELADAAEALGIDEHELETELKELNYDEDEDLAFSSSNILEDQSHHFDFSYKGLVGAYADLGVCCKVEPGDDLAALLLRLAIPVDAYLAAARDKMADEISDGSYDPKAWGLTVEEDDETAPSDEAPAEVLIDDSALLDADFAEYAAEVRAAVDTYRAAHAASFTFTAPPVVDVKALVSLMTGEWKDQNVHLCVTLGHDMIEKTSYPISGHLYEADRGRVCLAARSGLLSKNGDPCDPAYHDVLVLRAPLSVPLSDLRITKETPESNSEDALVLPDARLALVAVAEARWRDARTGVIPPFSQIEQPVRNAPLWLLPTIGRAYPEFAQEIGAIQRDQLAQTDRHALGAALVKAVTEKGDQWQEKAMALLELGADPNASSPDGVRPVHVATRTADLALLVALHQQGADLQVPLPDGTGNLWTLAMTQAVEKSRFQKGPATNTGVVDWLMAQGVMAPLHHPTAASESSAGAKTKNNPVDRAIDLIVRLNAPSVLTSTLAHLREHADAQVLQTAIDRHLVIAALSLKPELIVPLVEAGANLQQTTTARRGDGTKVDITLEERVRLQPNCEERDQTLSILKALHARQAMAGLLAAAGVGQRITH